MVRNGVCNAAEQETPQRFSSVPAKHNQVSMPALRSIDNCIADGTCQDFGFYFESSRPERPAGTICQLLRLFSVVVPHFHGDRIQHSYFRMLRAVLLDHSLQGRLRKF